MIYLRFIFVVCLLLGVNLTSTADYRIEPGDTLLIVVIGQTDYNQSIKVRADGKISYFGGDLSGSWQVTRGGEPPSSRTPALPETACESNYHGIAAAWRE